MSREFLAASVAQSKELFERELSDLELVAILIDSKEVGGQTAVVALGKGISGEKHVSAAPGSPEPRLFFAEHDFAVGDHLIVERNPVFVRAGLGARAWSPTQQAHARRGLEDIGRKRAAVRVKLNFESARVGDPHHLLAGMDHRDLGDDPDQNQLLGHDP